MKLAYKYLEGLQCVLDEILDGTYNVTCDEEVVLLSPGLQ